MTAKRLPHPSRKSGTCKSRYQADPDGRLPESSRSQQPDQRLTAVKKAASGRPFCLAGLFGRNHGSCPANARWPPASVCQRTNLAKPHACSAISSRRTAHTSSKSSSTAGHQRTQRTQRAGNTRGRPRNTALGWKAIAPGGLRRGIRRKFPAPSPTSAARKPPHQSPARPADQPDDSPPPAWTPAARCRK